MSIETFYINGKAVVIKEDHDRIVFDLQSIIDSMLEQNAKNDAYEKFQLELRDKTIEKQAQEIAELKAELRIAHELDSKAAKEIAELKRGIEWLLKMRNRNQTADEIALYNRELFKAMYGDYT